MNNLNPQPAGSVIAPKATFTPIAPQDAVTTKPTTKPAAAKGDDDVMSQPAKQS